MAFTVTKTISAFGNERVVHLAITADAATQTVDAGLKYIVAHSVGIQSCSTAAIKVWANSGAGGTSTAGSLGISGCASGDQFFVTVYGR